MANGAGAPLQDPVLMARAALAAGDVASAQTIRGHLVQDSIPGSNAADLAILDALRPGYLQSFGYDTRAFHEAFGDVTAMIMSLRDERTLDLVMAQTNGDLSKPNAVAAMGEHVRAMLDLQRRGAVTFDYGNNLRAQARGYGIDPARLIFAGHVASMDEHLARQRAADLFLDTLPYNAHTTASAIMIRSEDMRSSFQTQGRARNATNCRRLVALLKIQPMVMSMRHIVAGARAPAHQLERCVALGEYY